MEWIRLRWASQHGRRLGRAVFTRDDTPARNEMSMTPTSCSSSLLHSAAVGSSRCLVSSAAGTPSPASLFSKPHKLRKDLTSTKSFDLLFFSSSTHISVHQPRPLSLLPDDSGHHSLRQRGAEPISIAPDVLTCCFDACPARVSVPRCLGMEFGNLRMPLFAA